MNQNQSIYLVMMIKLKEGAESAFGQFVIKNAPLLKKHNIHLLKSFSIQLKGQLVAQNNLPQPDVVSIFEFATMESFMAYMSDPDYLEVAALRAEATSSVIGYFSYPLGLPEQSASAVDPQARLYVVGLANFHQQNESGIDEFNRQAISRGLFSQHGMHVEMQLKPFKSVVVVGDAVVKTPDRIQVFYIGGMDAMKGYVSDPLYKELSPLRDNTLTQYDFFAGQLK